MSTVACSNCGENVEGAAGTFYGWDDYCRFCGEAARCLWCGWPSTKEWSKKLKKSLYHHAPPPLENWVACPRCGAGRRSKVRRGGNW